MWNGLTSVSTLHKQQTTVAITLPHMCDWELPPAPYLTSFAYDWLNMKEGQKLLEKLERSISGKLKYHLAMPFSYHEGGGKRGLRVFLPPLAWNWSNDPQMVKTPFPCRYIPRMESKKTFSSLPTENSMRLCSHGVQVAYGKPQLFTPFWVSMTTIVYTN